MKRKAVGIAIRTTDFSNSSQVVSLFTREAGLLDGLAKGAHRERSSFQGPFDLAVLYEVVFIERRAAGLALLTESVVLDGFRGARRSWGRHVACAHLIEFLRAVATAGEPASELFELVVTTLTELDCADPPRIEALLTRFDLRALRLLGLFAPLASCVACGRSWSRDDRPVFFSTRDAGLLCGSCRGRRPVVVGAHLPGPTVRLVNDLADGRALSLRPSSRLEGTEAEYTPLRPLVAQLRTNLLERELVLLKSSARWL